MKTLIIDYQSLFFRITHSVNSQVMGFVKNPDTAPIENVELYWRGKMLNDLINLVHHFKPTQVIISFDHYKKPFWRKTVYRKYKSTRSVKRDNTGINFKEYFLFSDRLITELKVQLPNFKYLDVPECETDDNVAVLCKQVLTGEVVIFSSDGDFNQLKGDWVKCFEFSRVDRGIVQTRESMTIDSKVICGDSNDDIPNIFVMEGFDFSGKTIGLGEVTAQKVLENGIESDFCVEKVKKKYPNMEEFEIKANLRDNFIRNQKLISFNFIPFDIAERIKAAYEELETYPYSPREFQNYLNLTKVYRMIDAPSDFHVSLRNVG